MVEPTHEPISTGCREVLLVSEDLISSTANLFKSKDIETVTYSEFSRKIYEKIVKIIFLIYTD